MSYTTLLQWDDTYIYLIMEYCSGGDLSRFIRSKRMLPEHIVRKFLRHIVAAIQYLRDNSVAHMDLKPQNILCTSATDPTLKIADFGFAKHLYQGDELHALRGSPLYMAPEIICKGQYDARVDLWSIGVIFYECLFGRAPYASKSFRELQEKIWDPKPVELPYGVDVSESCRDLILRLLKRDPEERIQFEEFFVHPFLDLEHMPSKECLPKATKLVKEAVALDNKGDFPGAVKLYCEAAEYFLPAIKFEKDATKKEILRKRAKDYMNRAEELKQMLKPAKNRNTGTLQRTASQNSHEELFDSFDGCDDMRAALKVAQAAVIEEDQEDYENAMKHYELAIGTAIQYLKSEPKGRRKDLLRGEADKWMTKAEQIKSYLAVKEVHSVEQQEKEEETEKSFLKSGPCRVQ